MAWKKVSTFVFGFGALLIGTSRAATIRVPEDSPSVLAAVDLAVPGDSVLVGPGTWTDTATRIVVAQNGSFTVTACAYPRGGVVIRGQGPSVTILDVSGATDGFASDIVFAEQTGQGPLRVEQMTITGVRPPGEAVLGLYCDGLEIRGCRLGGNENPDGGAAVATLECAVTMNQCEIVENTSTGVLLIYDAVLNLSECRFEANTGNCVYVDTYYPLPAVIQDCEFIGNRGPGFGVAVNLQNVGGYTIERSLFLANVADFHQTGAGVRASGSSGEIRNNVFAYDSCLVASSLGAGIRFEYTTGTVVNNTFVGCYSTLPGAAFSALQSNVTFQRNVVAYSPLGAGINTSAPVVTVSGCNLFWANAGGNYGNWPASSTDFTADPLFCDLETLDFTVRDNSPCLNPPTPSCAPIGALGVGCGSVSIEAMSFGRIKAMYRE